MKALGIFDEEIFVEQVFQPILSRLGDLAARAAAQDAARGQRAAGGSDVKP